MEKMVGDWVMLASAHGAGFHAQDAKSIDGVMGWFQYVSKHAARGVKHYQRSIDNAPEAWKKKTGRMWGKVGEWVVREKVRINLQDQHGDGGYFAYRRMVRSWRHADARAKGDVYRVVQARRMLRCNHLVLSRVRGCSEWISEEISMTMIANLASRGYSVTC
jgi:hypothetical protein